MILPCAYRTPASSLNPLKIQFLTIPAPLQPSNHLLAVGRTCPCGSRWSAWAAPPRAAVGFGSAPPPADVKEVADRLPSATCGRGLFREFPKGCFSLTAKDKPMTLVSYRCCLLGSPPFVGLKRKAKENLASPIFDTPNNNSHPKRVARGCVSVQ